MDVMKSFVLHLLSAAWVLVAITPIPAAMAAGVSVQGSLSHERAVQPGDRFRGTIELRNAGGQAAQVKVFQTDYAFSADGRNAYGPPGRLARSNASWIKLDREQVEVPAQGTVTVQYTVAVPSRPLTGTYWSLLMIEPVSAREAAPPAAQRGKVSVGLAQVVRYAVQIVTDLGDSGRRELVFGAPALAVDGAARVLKLDAAKNSMPPIPASAGCDRSSRWRSCATAVAP